MYSTTEDDASQGLIITQKPVGFALPAPRTTSIRLIRALAYNRPAAGICRFPTADDALGDDHIKTLLAIIIL
ncbi:hypothetical protein V502_05106 [Pseudogymnoascus sp. VKM F-4520 (FW-2644)]|nr:hypothetical protein V502_05106 [Pseudogymnoascus sp. VKM F-4520 (FW-2644)]